MPCRVFEGKYCRYMLCVDKEVFSLRVFFFALYTIPFDFTEYNSTSEDSIGSSQEDASRFFKYSTCGWIRIYIFFVKFLLDILS